MLCRPVRCPITLSARQLEAKLECHISFASSSQSLFATGAFCLRTTFKRKGFASFQLLGNIVGAQGDGAGECDSRGKLNLPSQGNHPGGILVTTICIVLVNTICIVSMIIFRVKTSSRISHQNYPHHFDDPPMLRQGQGEKLRSAEFRHRQCDRSQDERNQAKITFSL